MCGIAGILQGAASTHSVEDVLGSLRRSLCHRGPDDHGQFVSATGQAGLAHTRLSILDLTAAGHQPMHSPDGRYTITFNGEIYNFLELRRELQQRGEVFRTGTDTEVLLRLYACLGPGCVDRLRGMFAFAIWDASENSCFLARDLFGVKPIYYHQTGERLIFASELRALLNTGMVPRRLNPTGVAGYFRNGTVPEPDTLVQDVRCLRAGHALLWRSGKLREYQYGSLAFAGDSIVKAGAAVKGVRDALEDSVEHHFLSDLPVGIFLSGGIDSTALLALASHGKRQDIRTFCIRFAEQEFDEGALAKRTAAHFGSAHSEWQLDAATGRGLLKEFLAHLDQPTIDGFNTFIVAKFAHEQGMKVVLSGLGGDELFGGYPSFLNVPRLLHVSQRLQSVGMAARLGGAALERFAHKQSWRRLGRFLQEEPDVRAAYQAYRGIFLPADASRFARGYTQQVVEAPAPEPGPQQPTIGDEVSALELQLYMRNQLLRDSDVMSMAWGLELRVPFIDQHLIARLSAIPSALRLQHGKKLLLQAVPEIPDWIINQPKRGFVFPFTQWFDSDWEELFRGVGDRWGICSRTWYQTWAIFVFEHWCREHGVS